MSDETKWAGLSSTYWAIVAGVIVVVLMVVDRYIHWTRGLMSLLCGCCTKPPPDPLAGTPEQPETVDDSGFKRNYDRDFEQGWHTVALQRDETPDDAEKTIRQREEQFRQQRLEETKQESVQIVRGVATVGGIQTE
ncbi:unnamed protein product [Ascophyllum nodosum]